jgi:hypothetical protein
MRELTLIGLDVDGKHLICEGGYPADKFLIRLDDRLRAAARDFTFALRLPAAALLERLWQGHSLP